MKMVMDFDERLVRAAEARAVEEGETLATLVGRILADYVWNEDGRGRSFSLLTKCGRPVPGVNVDSRVELYELMDARD